MKPREFERLNRGFLIREELEWARSRALLATIRRLAGDKVRPEQIKPLTILDRIAVKHEVSETEEHNRLRDFVERYKAKHGSY